MREKVELTFNEKGNKAILGLRGRFTLDDKEVFQNFVDQHVTGSHEILVLDMSQLDFIDSAGIGDLIKLKMGPGKNYSALYVMGLQDAVERVFRVSGLIQLFDSVVEDDLDSL
ncbi:MAG: STAS domain-containing protein [bacterium]|nr:STAS domain-containing protein [bacterium]